ncbi:hypothetical protein ACFO1B_17135 [Dactylosporangium siamense]|uniref:Uncharacterized protein n=1 Tax=Dactylosporangium siamense TaxID=685454 RepID=A0A919UBD7_9ACTN|nr:hypothetical protein [Dactylosporangium siamense]GIG45565.1 hypothetical protein Dsi01nite_036060 [Dactylosporangium siamense]
MGSDLDAARALLPGARLGPLGGGDRARRSSGTPALAELSGRRHDTLTERWGSVPLPYVPAFDPRP